VEEAVIEALLVLAGAAVGVVATLVERRRRAAHTAPQRRVLFPYLGAHLSVAALDAALRIARVEEATLVPVYLAPVPLSLALEAPIPRTCDRAFDLQEAIEQHAAPTGVPVDGRIVRGRTVRHALRELLATEPYDRVVIAAATARTDGLSAEDVAWLLEHADGDVVVLRPADQDLLAA
jgi:hypothetical protein